MFLADKALILLFNIRHDDLLEKFTLRLKNKVALQYVLIMSLSLYLQTALIKTLGAPFQRKTKPNTSTNITCNHPPPQTKRYNQHSLAHRNATATHTCDHRYSGAIDPNSSS
jgi:hypothetical protein